MDIDVFSLQGTIKIKNDYKANVRSSVSVTILSLMYFDHEVMHNINKKFEFWNWKQFWIESEAGLIEMESEFGIIKQEYELELEV